MAVPNERENTATDWLAVTPSDTVNIENVPVALWVNVGGDIAIVSVTGNVRTITVSAGLVQVQPRRINATNTTATGITALYNN